MSEEEMLDDLPVDVEADTTRLTTLERKYDRLESQNEATHKLLQTLIETMGVAPDPATKKPPTIDRHPPSRTSDSPASSAGRKKLSLKPSTPSEFDGERSKGRAFLTSCRTYIRLCPEAFDDEVQQIIWAMSYMKAGRAS